MPRSRCEAESAARYSARQARKYFRPHLNQLFLGTRHKDFIPDAALTLTQKITIILWVEIQRWKYFFTTWNKKRPPNRIYMSFVPLSEQTTLALKKAVVEKKVSLGSISCILAAKLFKAHFHPEKSKCSLHMTLDIRRYTPYIKKDMLFGFAPMIFPKFMVSDDEDVWEQARLFDEYLIDLAITKQETHNHSIHHSFKLIIIFSEYLKRFLKLKIKRDLILDDNRDFTFLNLGKQYPLLKNPEFEMQDTIFAPEMHLPWYNSTIFGVAETFSGIIGYAFFCNDYFISKEKMMVIQSEFVQAITKLVNDDTSKDDNNYDYLKWQNLC
jgi:hypothetical protein